MALVQAAVAKCSCAQAIAAGDAALCQRMLRMGQSHAVLSIAATSSESTASINPRVTQLQMLALLGHAWTLRTGRMLELHAASSGGSHLQHVVQVPPRAACSCPSTFCRSASAPARLRGLQPAGLGSQTDAGACTCRRAGQILELCENRPC